MKRRMVIAAHADDEAIGCGGTIAKFAARGSEHFVGVLTRDTSEEGYRTRRAEAETAWKRLGVTESAWAELRHHPLPRDARAVDSVAAWIHSFDPDMILVPHPGELDLDHAAVAGVVRDAMATTGRFCPLLGYEVWTPMAGAHLIEDISAVIDTKTEAIAAYKSQLDARRYDIAARDLAGYRGVMTGRGRYAEVFTMVDQ